MHFRRLVPLFVILAAAGLGACKETLDAGATCPGLCPAQSVTIYDTLISPAVVFDSTYVGYPGRGTEPGMLLATRGDTLEVRGIIRFDSLPKTYAIGTDTGHAITSPIASTLRLILNRTQAKLPDSVRFELYDVDNLAAPDTSAAAVLALFTPARRIGSSTYAKIFLTDTITVTLADSVLKDKIVNGKRLRIGVRVDGVGTGSVTVRAGTIENSAPALLSFRPTSDTGVVTTFVSPNSSTPTDQNELRLDLRDYQLVAKNTLPVFSNTMNVGGVPGSRTYLRFDLPRRLTDSTTIIRATLRLVQRPLAFGDSTDTTVVHAHVVLADGTVTDLSRATDLIASAGLLVSDSLLVFPRDSGLRQIEMYGLVRYWGSQASLTNPPPRAVVLRASPEALLPMQIRFFGSTAPAGVRPVLRLSYVKNPILGVP